MRLTYSVMTGSVMNLVLFSISMAYILPILISVSVEYQLPMPRPPMSRLPTALTSSMLPALTLTFWEPTSTTFSGLTATAATSPATGAVPGLQVLSSDLSALSFDFLPFAVLSSGAGVQSVEAVCEVAAGSFEVPGFGAFAMGGVSPGTGLVPGAGSFV